MATKDDKERFLSRWSRLKRKAREEPAQTAPTKPEAPQPAPELPPLDQLNFESDFKAFMDKRVDDGLRRMALKKLFTDPRFNVTDGLDVYAEDYSALEDLPKEMVGLQQHARRILRGPEPDDAPAPDEPPISKPEERPANEVTARFDEQRAPSGEGQPNGSDEPAPGAEKQNERRG